MSRGPWRFSFTYADVARAAGCSVYTVKRARSSGALDMSDLRSVMHWCASKATRMAKRKGWAQVLGG